MSRTGVASSTPHPLLFRPLSGPVPGREVGEDGGGERKSSVPGSNLPHAGYWPHSLGVNRSTKSHTVSREPGPSEPRVGERLATGNEGVGLQEAVGRVRR